MVDAVSDSKDTRRISRGTDRTGTGHDLKQSVEAGFRGPVAVERASGWWMRLLCQQVATRANRDDGEVGKFWQSRFRAVRLLR